MLSSEKLEYFKYVKLVENVILKQNILC